MYVLFIPSFPNNRFHLGNIRINSKQEKQGDKKGEKERGTRSRSLVSSLQTIAHIV